MSDAVEEVRQLRDNLARDMIHRAGEIAGIDRALAILGSAAGAIESKAPLALPAPCKPRGRPKKIEDRAARKKTARAKGTSRPEVGEKVAALWKADKPVTAIAKACGFKTEQSVYYWVKKLELAPRGVTAGPRPARGRQQKAADAPVRRALAAPAKAAPAVPKIAGAELDARILAMHKLGKWDDDIAAALDVEVSDVRAALVRIGARKAV